jgi:glycyl-tRNA synthetase (class II)
MIDRELAKEIAANQRELGYRCTADQVVRFAATWDGGPLGAALAGNIAQELAKAGVAPKDGVG